MSGYIEASQGGHAEDFIHGVWDALADFDPARADDSLNHLLSALCRIADAQNAIWVGAVRMPNLVPGDPAHGWRPRVMRYLKPTLPLTDQVAKQARKLENGDIDETTVRNIAFAGHFRVNRIVDLVPETWFESAYFDAYYRSVGHEDAIWVGAPVNDDVECYFGLFRGSERPRFTPEDRDRVAYALRSLKWFFRQQMLSYGLLAASSPLTGMEREVLSGLLSGMTEKQIAASLNHSPNTTHSYITSIYRKFGVSNRAGLMALWLGKSK